MEAHPKRSAQKFAVAVIGGGFTGTTLAVQLVRHPDPSFSVVVIDKAGLPGRGLAYGTECDAHLLNVPAGDMSAFADDREHFLRWAKSNCNLNVEPFSFLPRKEYGRYLGTVLSDAVLSAGKRLQWKREEVRAVSPTANGQVELRLRRGARILADRVVLALGNFPASDPPLPRPCAGSLPLSNSTCYFSNPWSSTCFKKVNQLESILLLGSGLTSVDVALELRHRGFSGTIHILSRRGLLPRSHKSHQPWPSFWNEHSTKSILGLLRLVRNQVRRAEQQGADWRSVINSLREVTPMIWQSLPDVEKRRFLRHVRPYWEIHRHRAAPEVSRFVHEQISLGKIQLHAGRIQSHRQESSGIEITCSQRQNGEENRLCVGRVINCTAPETDCRRIQDPMLNALLAQGLARPDPLFLGLDTSADGALIDREGNASSLLYAVGPARKGSLWESTAVPEIRKQVYRLAQHLTTEIATAHDFASDPARHEMSHWTNA